MAAGAVPAELAFVFVLVAAVAVSAQAAEAAQTHHRGRTAFVALPMAAFTIHPHMRAAQGKTTPLMQLKPRLAGGFGPGGLAVAGLAAHAGAVVGHGIAVTVGASAIFEAPIARAGPAAGVALGAGHLGVFAAQLEARPVVLEAARRREPLLGVAVGASVAQGGHVGILVAAGAGLLQPHPALGAFMTPGAIQPGVFAGQLVAGLAVIEGFVRTPADHLKLPTLVIAVAFATGLAGLSGDRVVVARSGRRLVAHQAELLAWGAARLVALAALARTIDLGVRAGQRTRRRGLSNRPRCPQHDRGRCGDRQSPAPQTHGLWV